MSFEASPLPEKIQEKKEKLSNGILKLQFQYIERIEKGVIPSPLSTDGKEFSSRGNLIAHLTSLPEICEEVYKNSLYKGEEYALYEKRVIEHVGELDILHEEYLEKYLTDIACHELLPRPRDFSLSTQFNYGDIYPQRPNHGEKEHLLYSYEKYTPGLEKFGISLNDSSLSIHIDSLYETDFDSKKINLFAVGKSLRAIAGEVRKTYPDVKAITASSWLLDTPAGKKLGFIEYENPEDPELKFPVAWGQFADITGNFHTERAQVLLTTGKPPFSYKQGFMKTEDFLLKYGSEK